MAGELKLIATPHRPAYQVLNSPQQAYILIEAIPGDITPSTKSQSVNLSLVLDRSGSMAGDRLTYMKEAASLVVDRLTEKDILSIVVFDDISPAESIFPSGTVQDRDNIKIKINGIEERGGTHMSTGMLQGLKELQKGLSSDRVSSMILLTDGQTWEDQQVCKDTADQCRASGIPIYVMGLGVGAESNWDPLLLEDLAQKSGGEWVVADSPMQVLDIFMNTLKTLQGTAVSNAFLTIRFVQGVTPRTVWRVVPLISRLDHQIPRGTNESERSQVLSINDIQVFLGDIQHGVGQSLLVDILLPSRPAGVYRFLQADITYDVPGSGLVEQKVNTDLIFKFVDDANQIDDTDGRIMNIIERVVAHRLQTQALDEVAAGNAAKATQKLRAAATRLLELGEDELAQQANQQAEKIEQNGQIDLAEAQKMRYATKRLTEMAD